jgi:hypothetical protein
LQGQIACIGHVQTSYCLHATATSDDLPEISDECREEVYQYKILRNTNINRNVPLGQCPRVQGAAGWTQQLGLQASSPGEAVLPMHFLAKLDQQPVTA